VRTRPRAIMTSNNRLMLCKIAGMQRTRSISRFRKGFNPSPIYSKSRVKRFEKFRAAKACENAQNHISSDLQDQLVAKDSRISALEKDNRGMPVRSRMQPLNHWTKSSKSSICSSKSSQRQSAHGAGKRIFQVPEPAEREEPEGV
jgi:hypothetical protein